MNAEPKWKSFSLVHTRHEQRAWSSRDTRVKRVTNSYCLRGVGWVVARVQCGPNRFYSQYRLINLLNSRNTSEVNLLKYNALPVAMVSRLYSSRSYSFPMPTASTITPFSLIGRMTFSNRWKSLVAPSLNTTKTCKDIMGRETLDWWLR